MVGALVDQVNPVTMLEKYPALAAVAKNNIQSDIAQDELPAFVELVQRMQKGSITSLRADQQEHQRRQPRLRQAPRAGAVRHRDAPPDGQPPGHPRARHADPDPDPSATPSVAPATDDLVSIKDAC